MNASYKIVLLGAFLLFAAVVGYYALSGGETEVASNPPNLAEPANPDAEPVDQPSAPAARTPVGVTPPLPRPVLDREPLPTPPEQVTIAPPGQRTNPTGDTLRGESPASDPTESVAAADPQDPRPGTPAAPRGEARPGPGVREPAGGPDTTTPPTPTDPATTTDDPSARPGPGIDTEPAGEEPSEPEAQPETETQPPAEPRRPVPPTPSSPPRHTVQAGETFASIALKVYGEEAAWFDIAQANPSVDPKKLQVDQVIVLPLRDGNAREPEEVTPPAPGKDQLYTVRPGDNLSRIAKRFYGDTEAWDLIYNRNRDKIGPRPDRLKVGMELIIPQSYNGAE